MTRGEIGFSWAPVAGADSYEVWRGPDVGGERRFLLTTLTGSGSNPPDSHYSDTAPARITWYYWVRPCSGDEVCAFNGPSGAVVYTDGATLNDTGITDGGNYSDGAIIPCGRAAVAGQDCRHGRDALSNLLKVGGGDASFDFTKLGSDGAPLALQNVAWNDSGSEAAGSRWACVRDNVTGLVWEVKDDEDGIHDKDNGYQWGGLTALGRDSEAAGRGDYHDAWNPLVNDSNRDALCGLTNWRAPTIGELVTLIHHGRTAPAIDSNYFPNTPGKWHWSATPHPSDNTKAMSVDLLGNGRVQTNVRGALDTLRLVSGAWEPPGSSEAVTAVTGQTHHAWLPNTTPDSRYQGNGDGTITDLWTGLMWQHCAIGLTGADCTGGTVSTLSWRDALTRANNSNLADHEDWRLPNIKELRTLIASDRHTPAINATFFPNTSGQFWSSSQSRDTDKSRSIGFGAGESHTPLRTGERRVRLVRGGRENASLDGPTADGSKQRADRPVVASGGWVHLVSPLPLPHARWRLRGYLLRATGQSQRHHSHPGQNLVLPPPPLSRPGSGELRGGPLPRHRGHHKPRACCHHWPCRNRHHLLLGGHGRSQLSPS